MRSELLAVVGKDRRIQMTDKPKLPYFVAAIAELQRVANMLSFVFFHRCKNELCLLPEEITIGTEDSIIGNKFIPKDTLTFPQIFSVLKDDPIFENPEEFRPERFLEADEKTVNKVNCINYQSMKFQIISESDRTNDCIWNGKETMRRRR